MHRYKFKLASFRGILGIIEGRYKVSKSKKQAWLKHSRQIGNDARVYLEKRNLGGTEIKITHSDDDYDDFIVGFAGTEDSEGWIGFVLNEEEPIKEEVVAAMVDCRIVRKLKRLHLKKLDEANEEYDEMLRAQELWEVS